MMVWEHTLLNALIEFVDLVFGKPQFLEKLAEEETMMIADPSLQRQSQLRQLGQSASTHVSILEGGGMMMVLIEDFATVQFHIESDRERVRRFIEAFEDIYKTEANS